MPRQREQRSSMLMAVLGASVLLGACGGGHLVVRQYGFDTATNACLKNPANCPPAMMQPVATTASAATGSLVGAAVAGGLLVRPARDLEADERAAVDQALKECADEARSEVMLKYFKDGRPTREECDEGVGTDRRGQLVTRAMQLGVEQHEVALRCAEKKLNKLTPGRFAVMPRYRFDPRTGQTEYIPREAVEELLRQGRSEELRGTLEPDLVIHEGNPSRIQEVYDFKFPCVNTDRPLSWREYSEGHPYEGRTQGDYYQDALGRPPARVQPRVGVLR